MSQLLVRCIKCGKTKPSTDFTGNYDVCTVCNDYQSTKLIKAFCFKCGKPIYDTTPHAIALQRDFTEFCCRGCFNRGKFKPRGELNYYKRCTCGQYFYTFDNRQKKCHSQCE